ncbi:MAG: xanthine dehydrogenase family protein subunit M [bacterium]|nr:xanthine dehydrogenase family protein subunit M [bacterium]
MKLGGFVYHRPDTTEEAVALLAEYGEDARVLAGGQSLLPLMTLRLTQPEHIVDVGRLPAKTAVDDRHDHVVVGLSATHAAVEASAVVADAAPLVAQALPFVGHPAIRSRGTVCGSLAHADPAAELPAVALAAEAELVVRSTRGDRVIGADEFFHGYLTTALEPDELLIEVRFKRESDGAGTSVMEFSRRFGDFALVGLATRLELDEEGSISSARLAFFGVGGTPVRSLEAEALLQGARADVAGFEEAASAVMSELDPLDDGQASSAYRRQVAGVLTRRALAEAHRNARRQDCVETRT